jgi:SAM-dependent methyltransferase
MDPIDARLEPSFFRHDRHTLVALRRAVEDTITKVRAELGCSPGTVVDIGAGSAPYRALFSQLGARYIACDLADDHDSDCGAWARGVTPMAPSDLVRFEDGCTIPLPSGEADIVVSFQVLEHVWDLRWYLDECKRLLAKDGRLILSTHGVWLYHPHPGDYRRWTRVGLVRELERYGFDVTNVETAVGPLAWTSQFRALAYHHVFAKIPLIGRALSALTMAVLNLRMLIEERITPPTLTENNAAVYVMTAKVSDHAAPKS